MSQISNIFSPKTPTAAENREKSRSSQAMPLGGKLYTFARQTDGIVIDKPSSGVDRIASKGGRAAGNLVRGTRSTIFDNGVVDVGQPKGRGTQGDKNYTDPFTTSAFTTPSQGTRHLTGPHMAGAEYSPKPKPCFRSTPTFDHSKRNKAFVMATGTVHAGGKKEFAAANVTTQQLAQPFHDPSVHRRFASSPKASQARELEHSMSLRSGPVSPTSQVSITLPSEVAFDLKRIDNNTASSPVARAGKRISAPPASLEGVMKLMPNTMKRDTVTAKPFASSTPRDRTVSAAGTAFSGVQTPWMVKGAKDLPKSKVSTKRLICAKGERSQFSPPARRHAAIGTR